MPVPRILIVDDERIVAINLHEQLEDLGYQPLGPAATGEAAITLAGELQPDLVLMDIQLGGDIDGVVAAREIRERFHIPSLFVTAFSEDATLERAKVAEPFGYILKPFEGRELKANIEMALYKHRMGEVLRQSQALLQSVTEGTTDAVYVKDLQGRYLLCNSATARFLGKPVTEILGRDDTALFSPGDAQQVMDGDRRVLAAGVAKTYEEFLTCDGAARSFLSTKGPVRDAQGKVIGLFGVARDITERKRLEEHARQAQKMAAIGHLAGGMAHEFNNILAGMMMALDLMPRQNLAPEAGELLGEISSLAQRSATLVRQLLAFSRQAPIDRKPLELGAVLTQSRNLLHRLLGERTHFEVAAPPSPTWVEADKTSMEQVLLNLCLNARDAMPQGGVLRLQLNAADVTAATAAAHPLVQPGKFVCLSVADTGCGMTPEIMGRLFEPFFTTKDVGQGTGLGLATVRGLVEQHHGWVEAESRVGRGSTFRIFLPAVAPPPPPPAAGPQPELGRGEGTILLVEDDPALRYVGERLLRHYGYTVLTAADGAEALAVWAVQRAQIDLLYTDVIMPGGLDGIQLARRILADQPGLKVIVTSGYNREMLELDKALDDSIIYLPKPCPVATLTQVIKDCLSSA